MKVELLIMTISTAVAIAFLLTNNETAAVWTISGTIIVAGVINLLSCIGRR